MKKVLIISYYWPPASGPGVQRWLKFARYLPDYGYQPLVITPKSGSYPNRDDTLLAEVPPSVQVLHTRTVEPFKLFNLLSGQRKRGKASAVGMADIRGSKSWIKKAAAYIRANWFIPDARVGWVPYALMAAEKLLKSEEVVAVITTGPPHSTHLSGLRLKRKYGIKWLADMRDPWTEIYYNAYLPRTAKSQARDQALEDEVLRSADLVLTVSPGLQRAFSNRAARTEVIYNGYDPADFDEMKTTEATDSFFKLSYVGNFKANQNIEALWQAIVSLLERNEAFKKHFRLELTGNISPSVVDTIAKTGLEPYLELKEFAEHRKAVATMLSSSVLLFPIPQADNNRQILTGKIFEYLASGTPMLSIGPLDGDAAHILSRAGRYPMIDYADQELIEKRLGDLFEAWLPEKKLKKVPAKNVEEFSRPALTGRLVELIETLRE